MTEAFPLQWPVGRPRTDRSQRQRARFDTTMGKSRDGLLQELDRMNASNVVISSNVATYRRGGRDMMYADQTASKDDPGVAVYYTWRGEQYALACDKWTTVADNLQALNKTVEAIRGIARWGTGEMMRAAFSGFKQLPQQAESGARPWREVLGVGKMPDWEDVIIAYRRLRKKLHPDAGGTHEQWVELQAAYEQAKSYYLSPS